MPDSSLIEATVESLGGLGDGIASHNGKPLFIPKACIDDRLLVRITHQNHDGAHGAIAEILTLSPHRATPPCPHFSFCGGCTLQQLLPEDYRSFKTRILHSALQHAGFPMTDAEVTFLPAASRRRVEFKIAQGENGASLGLLPLRSHIPLPIHQCLILEPRLQTLIEPLNKALAALPFAEHIKSISLTAADIGIDMLVTLKENHPDLSSHLERIAKSLAIFRLTLCQPSGAITTRSFAPVQMQLGNYAVTLPPHAFLQATSKGQRLLTEAARTATNTATSIIDLFSGIGSYSFPLSQSTTIHAVELDETMVFNMQREIRQHAIANLTAEQRDLFKNPLSAKELDRFDAAIINPPRIGAKAQTEQLAASNIQTIVMISCNPATFTRDAKILGKAGFTLKSAQGIDQFVWSPHLEIVAVFNRP